MRATTLFALFILGCAGLVIAPTIITGQPGGGKKNRGGGGGGGPGWNMMSQDPNVLFEMWAKDRKFFLITDTRSLRDPLTQYAQEKGITNGQITRSQFVDYMAQAKAKMLSNPTQGGSAFGGGFGKKKGGDMGSLPPGVTPGTALSADAINQLADADFKERDKDGDRKLSPEEVPLQLKFRMSRWDKNGDGFIDLLEYRDYCASIIKGGGQDTTGTRGIASIVIDDDELDKKAVVFRVGGKMPPGLPAWFKELDTDNDGQVALYEWRKGGKDLDEFKLWDLNDDGVITVEEAVKHYASITTNASKGAAASPASPENGGGRPAFRGPGGGTPGGSDASGGFKGRGPGGKKKGGQQQP
jgi:Ca2+-binding EF-hand superfamily protein